MQEIEKPPQITKSIMRYNQSTNMDFQSILGKNHGHVGYKERFSFVLKKKVYMQEGTATIDDKIRKR